MLWMLKPLDRNEMPKTTRAQVSKNIRRPVRNSQGQATAKNLSTVATAPPAGMTGSVTWPDTSRWVVLKREGGGKSPAPALAS